MNGVSVYKEHTVVTQNKGRLIVMLYEGAIKFLNLAAREIEQGDLAAKGQHITKAQDIINELNAVLDIDAGGEVSGNLRRLYLFMIKRLSEANTQRDPRMVRDVIKLLEELNQSWKVITA